MVERTIFVMQFTQMKLFEWKKKTVKMKIQWKMKTHKTS